jgi:DNA transposition AAA+ family ATPase
MTRNPREIAGVCELALKNAKLVVVVGHPGVGKTDTLKRWVARNPGAVMVRANGSMSAAGLCIRIGEALGLELKNGMSLDFMLDSIVKDLRRTQRLLIVDEADYLATRSSLRKVELLRTIYDESGAGMVLAGMPRLLDALTAGMSMRENLAQLYSRVAVMRRLHGFAEAEVRAFCRRYEVSDDAFQLLCKFTNHEERGGLRRLSNLLANASFLADGQAITAKHVKDAAAELELTRQ